MPDDDERYLELYKKHGASIEKYVYYIMALTVAAIGYSIDMTKDEQLSSETWFIVGALLVWAYSFYNGSRYLIKNIGVIALNMEHLTKPIQERPKHLELLKNKSNDAGKYYINQGWSFGLGIFIFILWYFYHLYNNSFTCSYFN